jgi:hypothetical protein
MPYFFDRCVIFVNTGLLPHAIECSEQIQYDVYGRLIDMLLYGNLEFISSLNKERYFLPFCSRMRWNWELNPFKLHWYILMLLLLVFVIRRKESSGLVLGFIHAHYLEKLVLSLLSKLRGTYCLPCQISGCITVATNCKKNIFAKLVWRI